MSKKNTHTHNSCTHTQRLKLQFYVEKRNRNNIKIKKGEEMKEASLGFENKK